ncbi:MAG: hypothetical protein DRI65_11255 [Chloroflexota bacterium]|nr:MAG: hypothetical protein DRI65_11255 [Chloroflexota bacterium]
MIQIKLIKENKLTDQAELKADVIEVTVSGIFKTEHVFNTPDGVLGTLTIKGSKGEGSFTGAGNLLLDFKKPSVWKSQYEFREGNAALGKAQPPKKLSRAFNIGFDGESYQLKPGGSKLRSWTLKNSQGQGICEILPRGGLKRGAFIRIGAEIPLKLLVFTYYLVVKRWQEESAAAAA